MLKTFSINNVELDMLDVKMLAASRGVMVDEAVYESCSHQFNISRSARKTTCMIFSNGFVAPFYDMSAQIDQAAHRYHWSEQEKREFTHQKVTPLHVSMDGANVALTYQGEHLIDHITFPRANDFYQHTTRSGIPFHGAASLLGNNTYVVFGYEWPCEFAQAGFPCHYCHAGNETAAQTRCGEPLRPITPFDDMAEIVQTALDLDVAVSILYTGGSTIDGKAEHTYLEGFAHALNEHVGRSNVPGEILYYLTPPQDLGQIDAYVDAGVDKLGMSVEIWDEKIARRITPGKILFTTRQRHLKALEYVSSRYGANRAFSQFIIGCEPLESVVQGAAWMAERGINPVFSILQQHSLKIDGKTEPPSLDFFRRAKEIWLDLYTRYDIVPAGREYTVGCIESEFYNEVHSCEQPHFPRKSA